MFGGAFGGGEWFAVSVYAFEVGLWYWPEDVFFGECAGFGYIGVEGVCALDECFCTDEVFPAVELAEELAAAFVEDEVYEALLFGCNACGVLFFCCEGVVGFGEVFFGGEHVVFGAGEVAGGAAVVFVPVGGSGFVGVVGGAAAYFVEACEGCTIIAFAAVGFGGDEVCFGEAREEVIAGAFGIVGVGALGVYVFPE